MWYFWSNHRGRHFLLLFLGFILTYKQLAHSLHRNYPSSWMTSQRLVFSTACFTCDVFYLGWMNLLITGGMCKATPPLSPLLFFERRGRLYRGYPIYGRMRYVKKVQMKLNKYLFNIVNHKERGCGQQSVVWLKRDQPCLHHLHVLSTVFSWGPFSSFSLWIILLLPIPTPPPPLFFHC